MLENGGWSVNDCSVSEADERRYDRQALVVARAGTQGLAAAGMRGLIRKVRSGRVGDGAVDSRDDVDLDDGEISAAAKPGALLLAIRDEPGAGGFGFRELPQTDEVIAESGERIGGEMWDEVVSGPVDAAMLVHCAASIDRWLEKTERRGLASEKTNEDAGGSAVPANGVIGQAVLVDSGDAEIIEGLTFETSRAIADRAHLGVVVFDAEKEVVYSNPAHIEILGIGVTEAGGIAAWLRAGCPDREYSELALEEWQSHIWQKQLTRIFTLKSRDEKLKEVEFRPRLLDDGLLLLTLSDITETRRSRDALAMVQSKFKTVFAALPIGVAVVDRTGRFFDVNPALERLFGKSRIELLTSSLEECLADDGLAKLRALEQLCDQAAGVLETEIKDTLTLASEQGEERFAEVTVSAVEKSPAGGFLRSYFFREVTDEVLLRRRLRASQEQNRALLTASPDVVLLLNRHGGIEDIVLPGGGVFGENPDLWIGRQLDDLLPGFGISEVLSVQEVIHSAEARHFRFSETLSLGGAGSGVGRLASASGSGARECEFDARVVPCGVEHAVAIVRDVTLEANGELALKRQELLGEHLQDAVIVCSPKGRIEDWNAAAERVFGYRRHEVIGCGLSKIYAPEESQDFNRRLSRELNEHQRWSEETTFVKKNGEIERCEVLFLPIMSCDGLPLSLMGIHRPLAGDKGWKVVS